MSSDQHLALEIIDLHAVRVALGGISARTLRRLIDAGKFPEPVSVTTLGKGWLRQDVDWFLWGQQIARRLRVQSVTASGTAGTTGGK